MTPPVLIFAWGNPSRGDDALGPLFAERLEARLAGKGDVEFLTDFQLQVEHALDLHERRLVVFADATQVGKEAFAFQPVHARRDPSLSSHALSPQALLQTFVDIYGVQPPTSWLMSIRGEGFDLGTPLSESGASHLKLAIAAFIDWWNSGMAASVLDR